MSFCFSFIRLALLAPYYYELDFLPCLWWGRLHWLLAQEFSIVKHSINFFVLLCFCFLVVLDAFCHVVITVTVVEVTKLHNSPTIMAMNFNKNELLFETITKRDYRPSRYLITFGQVLVESLNVMRETHISLRPLAKWILTLNLIRV